MAFSSGSRPVRRSLIAFVISLGLITALTSCNSTPIRKSVTALSDQELKDYVDAILKLKTTPSPYDGEYGPTKVDNWYDAFVLMHNNAFFCDAMWAHSRPAFLPWHRQMLLLYEQALSTVAGKRIMLPYWDWTDQKATDLVFSDKLMGPGGDADNGYAVMDGPFAKGKWELNVLDRRDQDPNQFRYLVRVRGSSVKPALPSQDQVDGALSIGTYDVAPWNSVNDWTKSFRNNLEGWRKSGESCVRNIMESLAFNHDRLLGVVPPTGHPPNASPASGGPAKPAEGDESPNVLHNAVHLYIAGKATQDGKSIWGTMALNTSPNDPVFFLHHANIDRIFQMWLDKYGKHYLPTSGDPNKGQNIDDVMEPFNKLGPKYGGEITPRDMLDISKLNYRYG